MTAAAIATEGKDSMRPESWEKSKTAIDPDLGWVDERSTRQMQLEYVLMCLCNIAWAIDASCLPTFFHEFQVLFGVSQTSLSSLSTAKGWVAALFAFPCGFLGEMLPRPQLISMGMLFWAAGLTLCAAAPTFEMIFVGRVLNGIGLGITQPLLLSLVAEKSRPTQRGMAFGTLFFISDVARTIFTFLATRYAVGTIFGIPGWRFSLALVVAFTSIVGVLVGFLVTEPHAGSLKERRKAGLTARSIFVDNMPKVLQLFKYPTFVLVLCQGAPGTAPWTIFPFFTQWLELSCFEHKQAAWIFSAFGWGNAFSNILCGVLLNAVARRFPDYGPPAIANFSVASGVPFLVIIFFLLPTPEELGAGQSYVASYFLTFLFFGLGAAMCGTINKKVFADIVPPAIFTYVFAIDQLIENGLGNLVGLSVGILTDKVFHYDAGAVKAGSCAPEEGHKLGLGMFTVCCVAWFLCFSFYCGMYWTYPKDRRLQLELTKASLQKAEKQDSEGSTGSQAEEHEGREEASADEVVVRV